MRSNSRRWRGRLLPGRREVILSARVDYEQTGDQRGMSISEKGWEENIHISQLREDIEHVVKDRLPDDLAKIFGVEAEIRVIACRFGSLTLFFGVVLSGIGLIASYRDFFDSIRLIREHCESLLKSLLKDKYRHRIFSANVHIEYPRLREPHDLPLRYMKYFGESDLGTIERMWALEEPSVLRRTASRDGFFWFLLALCLLLLGALGVLVYAAVVQTYFP